MAATPANPLILYDIPSIKGPKAWSINMWKTRLLLNLKGIPYRTEWISYPDIAPTFEKLGIKPTGVKRDGRPHYTCPAIIDPTTPEPTKVSDSTPIALYIEGAYPDQGPKVFPTDSKDSQLEFIDSAVWDIVDPIGRLSTSEVPKILDPRSSEYYATTRSAFRGKPLEEVCLPGSEERAQAWKDLERGLEAIAGIYDKNVDGQGEYFTGIAISYADIFLAAIFIWARIPTDRDQDREVDSVWGGIAKLQGGRWAKFMRKFEGLLQVQ